ncbi:GNAT family N-acetyltransferase [Pedobacter sp. GR22-6]|uniref:GNAT family N-acetyltransferase n=1 Tax=Pedobacter sp. GR22-6 TaxID=3127957 RepID=UPI00307F1D3C
MLQLKPFTPKDFKRLISWLDNEEMMVQVAGPVFSFPLTEEQLINYLADSNRHAFSVVDADTDVTIGHAEVYVTAEGTAKICRVLIGEESSRGKGLGKELIILLVKFSVKDIGLSNIELNVYDWNTQAIKCYEQVGFVFNPDRVTTIEVKGETWRSLNMVFKS